MPTSLPCPSGSVLERRSFTTRPSSVASTSSTVEGGEFGAAEAAGEAEEQEGAVAAAGECIRQSVEHAANVGGEQAQLWSCCAVPSVRRIPFKRFADGGLLHGSGRGLAGNLMGFGDGGQSPRHGRRPVGGGQRGEIQGHGFGAGWQRDTRRAARTSVGNAPNRSGRPGGSRGLWRREGTARLGRGATRAPSAGRAVVRESSSRRATRTGCGGTALPGVHCSSASSAARSSSRARARASAGDRTRAEATSRPGGAGWTSSPG